MLGEIYWIDQAGFSQFAKITAVTIDAIEVKLTAAMNLVAFTVKLKIIAIIIIIGTVAATIKEESAILTELIIR